MDELSKVLCDVTGATAVSMGEEIQAVWSGYGVIQRAMLSGAQFEHVVVKHIDVSQVQSNRRGWGGELSHQRKVRSYQIEKTFYESYGEKCGSECRIPRLVAAREKEDQGWVIVLEDLDAAGFTRRKSIVNQEDVRACLRWLANFHATYMNIPAPGLWQVGTYWHLATRPDEYETMTDGRLKRAASWIDQKLNVAKFKTLVHGDAKIANFCFGDGEIPQVAAVDYQYVGLGCGIKDVAYFLSSCLESGDAFEHAESYLTYYFAELRNGLQRRKTPIDQAIIAFDELEAEWRELYSFAWADFCRFLAGWSPQHWKLNSYSEHMTEIVLKQMPDAAAGRS